MAGYDKMKKTWFITGASSGLGLEIALAALREGHHVIGTGRDIAKATREHPEFAQLGGRWLQVDIGSPDCKDKVISCIQEEEDCDRAGLETDWVVVNNAGSTLLGVAEDMSETQIQSYFEANVYGLIRIWKAFLPVLRRNKKGTVITMSSIWGFVSKPEHMMYSAVKATGESLTESYASLLAPFGIRTLIIEPGGFRTPFASNNTKADGGISEDYKEVVEAWFGIVDGAGKDPSVVNGDPRLFGERVLDAVEMRKLLERTGKEYGSSGKALRIQLGTDCYETFGAKLDDLSKQYSGMESIAKSTDVGYE